MSLEDEPENCDDNSSGDEIMVIDEECDENSPQQSEMEVKEENTPGPEGIGNCSRARLHR